MEAIAKQAPDADLREQARATLVNVLGISYRYEEAFTYLGQALDELPHVTRDNTRLHILAEASQLLTEASQYDLAINYADQMMLTPVSGIYARISMTIRLDAEFRKGPHDKALLARLRHGVDTCIADNDILAADTLRSDIASFEIEQNKSGDAIALLQGSYAGMWKLQYMDLASQYDA